MDGVLVYRGTTVRYDFKEQTSILDRQAEQQNCNNGKFLAVELTGHGSISGERVSYPSLLLSRRQHY